MASEIIGNSIVCSIAGSVQQQGKQQRKVLLVDPLSKGQ